MATGIGENAPDRDAQSYVAQDDETLNSRRFYDALSAQDKLQAAFMAGNYDWGPGEVFRYNSQHTFVLAAAMDAYLKSMEGSNSNLWDSVVQEVLSPIGVRIAPMLHTTELDNARGVPFMGWGYFPTIGELAKIAQLFHDRGAFNGEQLLHAGEIDTLFMTNVEHRLPTYWFGDFGEYTYDFSFWCMAYDARDGCWLRIPGMWGFGGNVVTLMPNGMTGIRLVDADEDMPGIYDAENMAALADSLRSFCP